MHLSNASTPALICCMLSDTSLITTDCSSKADTMVSTDSPAVRVDFSILPAFVSTSLARPCITLISDVILSVADAVWLARFLTSLATTANPLPASPARAASIVALSANKLTCSEMGSVAKFN